MFNPNRTGIGTGNGPDGEPRTYRTQTQIQQELRDREALRARRELNAAAGDAALAGVEAAVVELPVEASEAEVVAA